MFMVDPLKKLIYVPSGVTYKTIPLHFHLTIPLDFEPCIYLHHLGWVVHPAHLRNQAETITSALLNPSALAFRPPILSYSLTSQPYNNHISSNQMNTQVVNPPIYTYQMTIQPLFPQANPYPMSTQPYLPQS